MASNLAIGVRNLVPEDATRVKAAMARAAELSGPESTFCEAHFVATAHAVKVVVFSVFNAFVYVPWGVGACAAHLWKDEGTRAIVVLGQGLSGALRSVVLVVVGVFYVAGGLIFPRWVFLPFAALETNSTLQPTVDPNNYIPTAADPSLPIVSPGLPLSSPISLVALEPSPKPPAIGHSSPVFSLAPPPVSRPPSTPIVSSPSLIASVSAPSSTPSSSSVVLIPSESPRISSQPRRSLSVVRISPEARKHSPILLDVQGIKQREIAQLVQWIAQLQASRLKASVAGLEGRGAGALIPVSEPVPVLRQQPRQWVLQVNHDQQILIELDLIGRREIEELVRLLKQQRSVSGFPLLLEAPKEDGTKFVKISPTAAAHLPKGDMHSYVHRFSPLYLSVYKALVARGKALADKFKQGITPTEKPRECMAAFVWHLMARAEMERGKGFEEGMFVIEDRGHRIHDFFAQAATKRGSSHFRGNRVTSLGMDIAQDGKTGLPAGHQTVHFGKVVLPVRGQFTFFKPESWGTESLLQIAGHGVSYVATRPAHLLGHATQAGQYKEHVSSGLKKQFTDFCREVSITDPNGLMVQIFGIGGMRAILNDHLKVNPKTDYKARILGFLANELGGNDHLDIRTGHEVILMQSAPAGKAAACQIEEVDDCKADV